MQTVWTTVIEQKVGDHWYYFSQQSIKQGERGLTDEEYLAACRRLPDAGELRISPNPAVGHREVAR